MIYNLHITKKAEEDMQAAADYIEFTLCNRQSADDLLDKAEQEINRLAEMPYIHRLVNEPFPNTLGIRFVSVNNYLAFFIIDEEEKIVYLLY